MSNQYYPGYNPTYTQILNLENIDSVSVEEYGESKYFNVDGLPRTMGYGKHYFTISYNDPKNSSLLKEDSSIMFEAIDERGNIIWSELTDYNDVNGAGIGYIWIKEDPLRTYDEIYNGIGKLIIVGKLEDETYIRYTIPLDIRKDYPNTSPVLFKQTPTVSINETVQLDKNDANFKRSYGVIEFDNLSTYGGYVHSIKLSTKSSKGKSDKYQLLDEFKVEPSFETLRSPVSSGSDYIGRFSQFTDTIQYWVTSGHVTSSHRATQFGPVMGFFGGCEISSSGQARGSIHYISPRKSTEEKVYDFKYYKQCLPT